MVLQIQKLSDDITNLAMQRLERPGRENDSLVGETEACMEKDTDDIRRALENGESDRDDRGRSTETPERRKRKREETPTIFSQLRKLLFQYPVSPIQNIINHPIYLQSKIGHLRARNCKVQDTFDHISATFISWKITEFYNNIYGKNDCIPIFSAGHTPIHDQYYSIEESLIVLNNYLKYQFNDDEELIFDFLSTLYNVLERKIPKLNAILVQSPPSSGKNFFFDCILDYFLNKGQLASRINKTNNFPYQECYGKRIILWNEPNYEDAATDQLKMILGGDAYTVNIKCKPDAAVYRTPVIILTNNKIALSNSIAFRDRIRSYTWKEAPYLKELNKKPYPLATYFIFKEHGFIK
jgi:hypothetical protein